MVVINEANKTVTVDSDGWQLLVQIEQKMSSAKQLQQWLQGAGNEARYQLASKLAMNAKSMNNWFVHGKIPGLAKRLIIEEFTGGAVKSDNWR